MPHTPHLLPYLQAGRLEAGCDEAGRGPLAGPVYAAAVILPEDFFHPLLNDSKQMSAKAREELREVIEHEALAWKVVAVQAEEIDRLNILWASVTGMQRAVLGLGVKPEFLLIDGNRFRPFADYGRSDYRTVVHGDATYASMDERMRALAQKYPGYGWERNMGYPTPEHIEAIRRLGYTPEHRKSFHPAALEPALF